MDSIPNLNCSNVMDIIDYVRSMRCPEDNKSLMDCIVDWGLISKEEEIQNNGNKAALFIRHKPTLVKILLGLINEFAHDPHAKWSWWALKQLAHADQDLLCSEIRTISMMWHRRPENDTILRGLGSFIPSMNYFKTYPNQDAIFPLMSGFILKENDESLSRLEIMKSDEKDIYQAFIGLIQKNHIVTQKNPYLMAPGSVREKFPPYILLWFDFITGMKNENMKSALECPPPPSMNYSEQYVADIFVLYINRHPIKKAWYSVLACPKHWDLLAKSIMNSPFCTDPGKILSQAIQLTDNQHPLYEASRKFFKKLRTHASSAHLLSASLSLIQDGFDDDMDDLLSFLSPKDQRTLVVHFVKSQIKSSALHAVIDKMDMQSEIFESLNHTAKLSKKSSKKI